MVKTLHRTGPDGKPETHPFIRTAVKAAADAARAKRSGGSTPTEAPVATETPAVEVPLTEAPAAEVPAEPVAA